MVRCWLGLRQKLLSTTMLCYFLLPSGVKAQPADLMLSGVPNSCFGDFWNGAWDYQDNTRDGKGYFKRDTGRGILYLYFDKDADGGWNTAKCGSCVQFQFHGACIVQMVLCGSRRLVVHSVHTNLDFSLCVECLLF